MRLRTVVLTFAVTVAVLPLLAQRRVKKVGDASSWKTHYAAAGAAFEQKSFGKCLTALRECTSIVSGAWTRAVAAAFPPEKEGWKRHIKDDRHGNAASAMLGLGSVVGRIVEATYNGPDGKRFTLKIHLDSAAVKMFEMQIKNPLMRPKNSEPIEYDGFMGLLETKKKQCTVRIVFYGRHYAEGSGYLMTGDETLGWMSQENMDRVVAAVKG